MRDDVSSERELVDRYQAVRVRLMGEPPQQWQRRLERLEAENAHLGAEVERLKQMMEMVAECAEVETASAPAAPAEPCDDLPVVPDGLPFEEKAALLLSLVPRTGARRIHRLLVVTAHVFGVEIEEIIGPTRHHRILPPRQLAMTICNSVLGRSSAETGRRFNRDHTTVLHARLKYGPLVRKLKLELAAKMIRDKTVRIQLIDRSNTAARPIGSHVAFVAIPRMDEAPSIVLWGERVFHRYAGACGLKLRDGDIYRECSAVTGTTIEEPAVDPEDHMDCYQYGKIE